MCIRFWSGRGDQRRQVGLVGGETDGTEREEIGTFIDESKWEDWIGVEQRVLMNAQWPSAEIATQLAAGFTITTVSRGPNAQRTETVYVVVLTRSPNTIAPRTMRSFGSCESGLERWRTREVRLSGSNPT